MDIVKRLREGVILFPSPSELADTERVMRRGADEIERLRAVIHTATREIADGDEVGAHITLEHALSDDVATGSITPVINR